MAKGRIESKDVYQQGLFDELGKSATDAEKNIKTLSATLKGIEAMSKKMKGGMSTATPKDIKGMRDFNEQARTANELAKGRLAVDKKLKEEKIRLQEQRKEENKTIKDNIVLESQESGTLEKVAASSRKLRSEREKLNLKTRDGQKRLREINKALDRNNKFIESNSDKMKKQRLGIGRYQKALGGLSGALAKIGVTVGIATILRSTIGVIGDFQQATANLASVLGVNVEEMTALTAQAKELGATTKFTASQVSELQLELAKLGFTQVQIQEMTESTLQLAAAAGTELGEAATVVGSTLRGFGLEADQTQRVVDVMAKSFSSSSLDMSKFSVAMASVAPVAKVAGLNVERTTALLGTLTDRGIDASTAGTGLKNMFLEMSKQGLTWDEAMTKINESTDKSTTALDLFGKRGATLGIILAENGSDIDALEGKLNDAGGAAKEMADKQLATLQGSLDLLKSAWEGQILSMDEAGGVGEKLRNGIAFLAENLDTIIGIIGRLIRMFVSFKTAMLAMKMRDRITDFKNFGKSASKAGENLTDAQKSARGFGQALKSIGFAIAIELLIELAKGLYDIASGARLVNETLEATEKINQRLNKTLDKTVEKFEKQIKSQRRRIDILKASGKIKPEEAIEMEKKAIEELNAEIEKEIRTRRNAKNLVLQSIEAIKELGDLNSRQNAELTARRENEKQYSIEILRLKDLQDGLNDSMHQLSVEGLSLANSKKEDTKATKEKNVVYEKQISLLDELNDSYASLLESQQALTQSQLAGQIAEANRAVEQEIENIARLNDVMQPDERIDFTNFEALMDARLALQVEAILEAREFEIAELQKTHDLRFLQLREAAKAEREQKISDAKGNAKQIAAIEKAFREEMQEIDGVELDAQQALDAQLLVGKQDTKNQLVELEQQTADQVKDIKDKQAEEDLAREKKLTEEQKQELKERMDNMNAYLQAVTDGWINSIDARIEKIDQEKEAATDRLRFFEEKAAEGNISAEESLAEQNAIIREKEAERRKEEQLKQGILMVNAFLQAYNNALGEGDEAGQALGKALTATALSSAAIPAIIQAVPTFLEGTEDTGYTGRGVDGLGGFNAILHPREGVIKREDNEKKLAAGLTNAKAIDFAIRYKNLMQTGMVGNMSEPSHSSDSAMINELTNVSGKLDNVTKAIENNPPTDIGKITYHTMQLIQHKNKGRRKTTTTYNVKV